MAGETDNLMPVYLRRIDTRLDQLCETVSEHGLKLNRLEESLAGVKRDIALHAEQFAHVEVRLDRVIQRLDRIERRLDLTEQPA